MSEILEYKCPCCSGAIEFNPKLQKLKCPYCDTEFDADSLRAYSDDLNSDSEDKLEWDNSGSENRDYGEADKLNVYICNSCGGEILSDENTAATFCPYCSNPVVLKGRLSGGLKPDLIIPFKFDKEAAKQSYKKHITGKRLLPKVFKDENHIDEIKGIYVPFWLFDADTDANMRYKATRVRTWSDANNIYTETSFYSVVRSANLYFENIPEDSSSKMPDDLMESLEPFDMGEAVSFNSAYLSGFFADKYDVDVNKSIERAGTRIKKSAEELLRDTVNGYATVTTEHNSVKLKKSANKYALLPVWLLNTTWKGEKFTFAMNGQTGKTVGNLPVDKKAAAKWTAGLTAGIGAVAFAVLSVLYQFG